MADVVRTTGITTMPEMTIQQAFNLAIQHQQAGRLQEAESICRQILAVEPRHAGSLHNLEGKTHVSRVGQTLHQAVGLEDLTGRDVDGYVELAVRLANDPGRLRELRSSMRERMLQSPLCDQPAFARNFEEALRGAWREWCLNP